MAKIDQITTDLLSLNVKEAIKLKINLEKTLGLQMLPTFDIRIVPGFAKGCGGATPDMVVIFITSVGDHTHMAKAILVKCLGERPEYIDDLITAGKGVLENKQQRDYAESMKSALEAVSMEVELK